MDPIPLQIHVEYTQLNCPKTIEVLAGRLPRGNSGPEQRVFQMTKLEVTVIPPYRNPDLPVEQRVADLSSRMTLEEKVAQLYCIGRAVEMTDVLFDETGNILAEKMADLFCHGIGQLGRPAQRSTPRAAAELTNAIQKYLVEETRLGIPALFNEEGLHGLMATGATSFPQAIALASTWDEALVEEVYTVVAREARSRGSNYVYAPVLDLARDPRWGRTEETFGEDPYLVSRIGVAGVCGLQGPGPKIYQDRVVARAKHYAVHGQPEGGLNAAPGNISERVIREEFLPPFQSAVMEAGVAGIPHPEKEGQEALKAWVVIDPEKQTTIEELVEFCSQKLAPYEVPRRMEFIDELPKTSVGKVLRRDLVKMELQS